MSDTAQLYGQAEHAALAEAGGYTSPDDYKDQGDTRKVRDLSFSYIVAIEDPATGGQVLQPRDVPRDTEVSIKQIGLDALMKGERNHSFYTSEELKRLSATGREVEPVAASTDISELGEFELAEWLDTQNPETGRKWTINEVLEQVGTDKDLANRMLQAENVARDGDPRDGLVQGLTRIIEGDGQQ